MPTVKAECRACHGTGLYQGFAESKDTAVVCTMCSGKGCEKVTYTPFEKRKKLSRRGVQFVQRSRGSLIATGVGPAGNRITLSEFYEGKMP